jgi:nicotinate phosphoribosyltransferase
MRQVMKSGERLPAGRVSLNEARAHARSEIDRLPAHVRGLAPARPAYDVKISDALEAQHEARRRAYE